MKQIILTILFTLATFEGYSQNNKQYRINLDSVTIMLSCKQSANRDSDNIQIAMNVLKMKQTEKPHRLYGTWKMRGKQLTNTATSQYWVGRMGMDTYQVFGDNGAVMAVVPTPNIVQCQYTACSYLSENVIETDDMICMITWIDDETISVTTLDNDGHPFVTIWDRCGLPNSVQKALGIKAPGIKKDISKYFMDEFVKRYGAKPDSIRQAYETFDFAIDVNERSNAIFPILMRCGFENEYNSLKDSLLSQLLQGNISADEAVGRYIFWFHKNFDRHTGCSSDFFWKLRSEEMIDYNNLIPQYSPQPVGCKVDDETYLLRLPSCRGENPSWNWMSEKEKEFKQSGCKYLILDLRGNTGGGDAISLLFTRFMCDCSAMNDDQDYFRVSYENNRELKKYCNNDPNNFHNRVMSEAVLAEDGSYLKWSSTSKGQNQHTPLVRKGAIIIDNNSASAAETPVRYVRNYSKKHAKVYGRENTMGCEETGNCNEIRLPNSQIYMRFPMTVESTFEKWCKKKTPGYAPDITIPLPYPEQLTDNIDSWVLWVAKDLKK